ncbi:MAG TPA: RDD family protein [Candidatus Thermoplasmatota archaeon]|nr:RDD family protein [Candidatus Thermoplasmatota archaeon]
MQMTTDARAWLDATVRRILARHPLGDMERGGITYEIMSHLHAAGEARASAAGRAEVTRGDLEAALAEAGGEERLAEAFVRPLAKPVERVLFWRRAGALAIDAFLLGIALLFVHTGIEYALEYAGVAVDTDAEGPGPLWMPFLPWGNHDASLPLVFQLLFTAASAALILGYFAWFEAREGRTPGKRALELRVMRADGAPMGYRESVVRNLAKLSPQLLVLDTAVMLLAFQKDKQRVSDRIAGTIVVRV